MVNNRYEREQQQLSGRKFFRVKDTAWLAGVCSGLAHYFGFRVGATRLLAFIAFLFMPPIVVLLYVGVTLLVPSRYLPQAYHEPQEYAFNQAMRSAPATTISDVRRRYQQIEARLARLERHVTSPRYRLDQEINNLK